jgi:hypothetical protein
VTFSFSPVSRIFKGDITTGGQFCGHIITCCVNDLSEMEHTVHDVISMFVIFVGPSVRPRSFLECQFPDLILAKEAKIKKRREQ